MELGHDLPRVLAVLVATDGAPTLPRALAGLAAQDYAHLDVVAVDNGSTDRSRVLLRESLGPERVLVAERDLGFGGAVDLALASSHAVDHPLVLLVHDDLELRDDAVRHLVDAFVADPQLAVAGCKLVEWDDARQLQAVGMRVDVTGRADSGVDDDEIDQGQHDHVQEVLYVSTAGMMVDRATFDRLGRLDVRYHLFRDDLDLCWRAHLAGHHVEVVTEAVAQHDASASTYNRLGQTAFLGPRYFAERNTLASLLKNYGAVRLLWVLPLFLLVGLAKVAGFVATRRLSDAWQTLRAWVWNVVHLRETRRLRVAVQALRVRPDGELTPLFGRVGTRVRAYVEALGDVVSGGSDAIEPVMPDPADVEVPTLLDTVRRTLRTSPVGVAASLLGLLGLVVGVPLLLEGGALRGGELAAWSEGGTTLLSQYLRPWTMTDQPGVAQPSSTLGLLGLVQLASGGSAWLAPRLLVLSIVPLSWVGSLRAGRLLTERRFPRVVGATLYALSPPVLAAVRTGQVRAALVAVLLPLVVVAGGRAFGPRVPLDRAWRAAALLSILLAVLVGIEPLAGAVLAAAAVGVVAAVVARGAAGMADWSTGLGVLARLGASAGGAASLVLASPPLEVLAPTVGGAGTGTPLWRVLLLAPELAGFGSWVPGAGLLLAALVALVVVDGVRMPSLAVLWVGLLTGVVGAWLALRAGEATVVWAGLPLVLVAFSAALAAVVAVSAAPRLLASFDFGWRQLLLGATSLLVGAGVVAAGVGALQDPWAAYSTDRSALPAFLATEPAAVGPFRVLVLADDGEAVRWQLTDADGPDVGTLAVGLPDEARRGVGPVLADVLSDANPDAAARLGALGVRYVVVEDVGASERLAAVLRRQLDLTGVPSAAGLVLRVDTWLPRWSLVPREAAVALAEDGVLPGGVTSVPLADGPVDDEVTVLFADTAPGPWQVRVDGEVVEPRPVGALTGWEVPAGAEVLVEPAGSTLRLLRVGGQVLLLLLALSLSLRAPRFARRAVTR